MVYVGNTVQNGRVTKLVGWVKKQSWPISNSYADQSPCYCEHTKMQHINLLQDVTNVNVMATSLCINDGKQNGTYESLLQWSLTPDSNQIYLIFSHHRIIRKTKKSTRFGFQWHTDPTPFQSEHSI
jgi:hypothetical protein